MNSWRIWYIFFKAEKCDHNDLKKTFFADFANLDCIYRQCCGSGWDPDPGEQKWSTKVEKKSGSVSGFTWNAGSGSGSTTLSSRIDRKPFLAHVLRSVQPPSQQGYSIKIVELGLHLTSGSIPFTNMVYTIEIMYSGWIWYYCQYSKKVLNTFSL